MTCPMLCVNQHGAARLDQRCPMLPALKGFFMFKTFMGAACAVSFGTAAFGHNAQHHHHHTHGTFAQGGQQVIVSCYRGPWNDVIWDRPNAVFIDSLVAVGYQYERAYAIARRGLPG